MVINQSGGVVLADVPADIDAELISLRFLGLARNCVTTLSELNQGKLECINFQTELALITAFECGEYWIVMLGPPSSRQKQLNIFEKAFETMVGNLPLPVKKFQLSPQDIKKLQSMGNRSELQERMATIEASEDLQTMLLEIGSVQGVIGCLVVGHDGLLIANTMPEETDAESIGVWALGEYMNTEHVMKKMGHQRVHQIVNRTLRGYVVVADFGGGLLVAITEDENLVEVMRKITDLVS
jgi:predicted regulator of Ras-like GTPase activity (Roadblock/LC7/MglB family)